MLTIQKSLSKCTDSVVCEDHHSMSSLLTMIKKKPVAEDGMQFKLESVSWCALVYNVH